MVTPWLLLVLAVLQQPCMAQGSETTVSPLEETKQSALMASTPVIPSPFRLGSGALVAPDPRPSPVESQSVGIRERLFSVRELVRSMVPTLSTQFSTLLSTLQSASDAMYGNRVVHLGRTPLSLQRHLVNDPQSALRGSRAVKPRHLTAEELPVLTQNRQLAMTHLGAVTAVIGFIFAISFVSFAYDFNHRRPPGWGPEMERSYSFRAWTVDIMHWSMLTDLQPHQQAAAILMQLTGAARDISRTISGPEVLSGGNVDGVHRDPVSYIIAGLRARFGQLEEETRIQAMTEMLAFPLRDN